MNYKLFEILVCFLYLLPLLSYKISLITFRMTLVYFTIIIFALHSTEKRLFVSTWEELIRGLVYLKFFEISIILMEKV